MTTLYFERMDSSIGTLTLAADASGLRHIEFPTNRHPVDRAGWVPGARDAHATIADTLATTRAQLLEYFGGARRTFELPLAPEGTPFQRTVWAMLAQIPWGATWSYGQLAKAIGQPAAVRAVGAAKGRNPLPIVLPCHRVIGSDGALTGFGGGLPIKAALLRLEGALPATDAASTGDLFG